jgi:hypothetical protein
MDEPAERAAPGKFDAHGLYYEPERFNHVELFPGPKSDEFLSFETSPDEKFPEDEFIPEPVRAEPADAESALDDSDTAKEPSAEETPLPTDLSKQGLLRLVKSLRLNFADVSFLFNASLSTVRMWRAGAALGAEEEMQLQFLLEVAERVEEMDIPRLDQAIRRSMPDGEFFMEKLKDRKVTDESLNALKEAAERSEELRRKFKGATKPFHDMQNAIGLYATSLHCEG